VYYVKEKKGDRIELGSCGMITGAFSSDTTISTPVAINKGGTGQTTAQAAIDALTAVSGASTNEVLTKDGSGNAAWAAGGGATLTRQNIVPSTDFSTASTSFVDVTGVTLTLPDESGGIAMLVFSIQYYGDTANADNSFFINDATVASYTMIGDTPVTNQNLNLTMAHTTSLSGQVVKLQAKVSGGTVTISKTSGRSTTISSIEIA